jgi:outer membrane biosynthesis protein TonB
MKTRIATLAVGLALFSMACADQAAKKSAGVDSSLSRDLALAGQQTAQTPTFQDTSVAPTPAKAAPEPKPEEPAPVRTRTAPPKPKPQPPKAVAQAPAPTPDPAPVVAPQPIAPAPAPAPASIQGEVAAGTTAGLTGGSKVCTSSNQPGDKLVATLNTPLVGTNGKTIPTGSTVVLELATATSGSSADATQMTFRVKSIVVNDKTYTVDAQVVPLSNLEKTKVSDGDHADAKKVAGGAIAGAILGQIIGHNTKGTLIGAAAGAAAGAAVAKSGEKWEACLPSGGQLQLKLNSPLVIT